ncbi:glycoside hydrolase family 43 protein [Deinococcus sp. UYEF24]
MTDVSQARPVLHDGYFADPFVLFHGGMYYAYGTGLNGRGGGRAFEVLSSPDLKNWTSHGGALDTYSPADLDYWAPEVAVHGGRFYLYYSAGFGDVGHHLRVAVADHPLGPFSDQGLNLTPDLPFAIDPSPFRDRDGRWYLYYARDLTDGGRPGTSLAVQPLEDMTRLTGEPVTVLRASSDWQLYQAQRPMPMYGGTFDWHTLEGAFVVRHGEKYHLFYSGGAWTNETYGVGHAVADHPLGPWTEPAEGAVVLRSRNGLRGPGHISVVTSSTGQDFIVYHAWDHNGERRTLHIDPLGWTDDDRPVIG